MSGQGKDEKHDYELKDAEELEEEFERMDAAEKNTLIQQYELLGIEVVRQQVNEYKSAYIEYKTSKDTRRWYQAKLTTERLERWFNAHLHTWVVTDLSGSELCEKIRVDVEKNGLKGNRPVFPNLQAGTRKEMNKGD